MKGFLLFFKYLLYIFFKPILPVKVIGKRNLPKKQGYISLSNHLGAVDVVVLMVFLPGFRRFLAKKELSKNPFNRWLLKMLGAIYIDRDKADLKAIKDSVKSLKSKTPLVIFPEGTRNKSDERLMAVKGGAAMIATKADVKLVPVMIHHRTKLFRKNYVYAGEPFLLPYTSKDRFNNDALKISTAIITEKMNRAKNELSLYLFNKNAKKRKRQIKKDWQSGETQIISLQKI